MITETAVTMLSSAIFGIWGKSIKYLGVEFMQITKSIIVSYKFGYGTQILVTWVEAQVPEKYKSYND